MLATAATVEDQNRTLKLARYNKIVFFILISLALISIALYSSVGHIGYVVLGFCMVFYFAVALALQFVINMFLYKLKLFLYHIYMQKK